MESFELEARECIRDLVARYNANGDSGRFDPMLELFAEEAVLIVPDGEHEGKSAIRAMLGGVSDDLSAQRSSGVQYIRHYTATHQIDVESETAARGRCYYAVLTDRGLDHWGRYLDEYRKIDGRWLFWRREVSLDGRVPGAWAK